MMEVVIGGAANKGVWFVPQDGCLAAIFVLLALNHSACLRNARRVSYVPKDCGLSLHRNKPFSRSRSLIIVSPPLPFVISLLLERTCDVGTGVWKARGGEIEMKKL